MHPAQHHHFTSLLPKNSIGRFLKGSPLSLSIAKSVFPLPVTALALSLSLYIYIYICRSVYLSLMHKTIYNCNTMKHTHPTPTAFQQHYVPELMLALMPLRLQSSN